MIPRIATALGISQALVWIGGIILLIGAVAACYDHSIVSNHDAKIEASAAKADRKADQKSAEQAKIDEARSTQEANQLIEAMDNAPKDPKVDDAVERRIAFHKCLGLQQRARANGLKPPTCV
jgi:hypothetical protein